MEVLSDPSVALLEVLPDGAGARIRGLDRYAVAWERQRKERARKAEWARGRRSVDTERTVDRLGVDAEKVGKTQTQTQTQKEASASQEPAVAVPVADDMPQAADEDVHDADTRPALVLVGQKAEKPARKPSKAEELYAAFQAQRRERCEEAGAQWFDDGWKAQRINASLGPLVRLDEAGKASLESGWLAFLDDGGGAALNPPWSLGYFLASQRTWESKAARRTS
jgi:hypothetical protein